MSVPDSTDQHLWVSWDDYHKKTEKLALLIYESGWEFDQILCLARGGLRLGDVLSRVFNVPLAILSVSSYRGEDGTEQGVLDIAKHITMAGGSLTGKLLLVDDLVDSGVTIKKVLAQLRAQFAGLSEIKVAAVWQKACSEVTPDYVVEYLKTNPWIHQPFEIYDSIRPDQLMTRINRHDK